MSIKPRRITIELDEETYRKLIERAEAEGFSLISDYIVALIKRSLSVEKPEIPVKEVIEKLKPKINRIVQDEVNRYIQVIVDIRKQIADLYEKLDTLSSEVEQLKNRIVQQPQVSRQAPQRKTGIERLREEKVVFESTLPPRLQRDRFFKYLEREGAVVIPLERERIAVDPEYWSEFKKILFEEINTDDEDVIKRMLGDLGYELFRRLREDSIIYFDSRRKKWVPASREYFK